LILDHVNAHKHFHLHPTIAGLLVKFAKRHGAKGARVPLEPQKVLRKIEKTGVSGTVALTQPFARALRSRFRRAGIAAPDQVFGLAWTGQMRVARLIGLLNDLPEGLSEIYMHPATGTFHGSADGYDYRAELAALIDPRMPGLIAAGDIRLGGFSDFPVH
jgi:predicted glycoside hydrolase/deacetylase ChbG (UPF0249 family)